ncbi:hypothetical protein CDAR_278541 [Caerostris darwini]|uniref:Uncharacterized protein n=1 Tax=Caerostris darwini TaxID=1538125 RepID=A0AAV4WR56_9ARAC|nr:hypothetical protein CDAR_278541 [Caerostris darwini]
MVQQRRASSEFKRVFFSDENSFGVLGSFQSLVRGTQIRVAAEEAGRSRCAGIKTIGMYRAIALEPIAAEVIDDDELSHQRSYRALGPGFQVRRRIGIIFRKRVARCS